MENTRAKTRFILKALNGEDFIIEAEMGEYANSTGHRATIVFDGEKNVHYSKRIVDMGDKYEWFKYERVIKKVITSYYANDIKKREYLLEQLKNGTFERKILIWHVL